MTLYELGEDYINQANLLKRIIKSYSVQIGSLNGIRLFEMHSKIVTLKEMERDMRITGLQLLSYYDGDKFKHFVSHNNYTF